jgi:cytochrome c biogenesis protein CcmG/thiol:disulfide interchange protein DsbE
MTTAKKRPTRPASAQPVKQRKIPWLGIVFGVIALALVAAIVFSSSDPIGSEFGDVTITGESLPPFADTTGDPAIGQPAPGLTGVDFDGGAVNIQNDDSAKAIVFLAHWCSHCQAEVPRVQAWVDSGGGVPGVEIYSVSTSMNSAQPNFPPSAWLDGAGWTAPLIRDDTDSSALVAYGAGGFPYWVFVDANGNVVRRSSGELDVPTLEAYMTEAAAG